MSQANQPQGGSVQGNAKRKINASALAADVRAGMNDTALCSKYGVTHEGMERLLKKLIDAGLLSQAEIEGRNRVPVEDSQADLMIECPACKKPQSAGARECHDCGVIFAKFKKREEKEKEERQQDRPVIPAVPVEEKTIGIRNRILRNKNSLQGNVALIAAAVVGIFLVSLATFIYWTHSQEQTRKKQLLDPMRTEIARDLKLLEMGLSLNDHRQMSKSFIQRLGELQLALKNEKPELIATLERAAKNLSQAEDAWRSEIDFSGQAKRAWGIKSLDQLRSIVSNSRNRNDIDILDGLYSQWSEAEADRSVAWATFKTSCEEAERMMR